MPEYTPNLPGPDADATQAPDQQTATGVPQGGQGSLLDTIQGMQGSIPNEAILGLLQGPSFGQKMGVAAAGGAAFMQGKPNPALAVLEQQQKQQLGIAQILGQMQSRQDLNTYRASEIINRDRQFQLATEKFQNLQKEQALKKDELALTAMRGVLDNENTPPSVLALVGPQYAARFKQVYQVDLPPVIAQRVMKQPEQDAVLMNIQEGLPPDLILKNHPSLTPEDLQAFTLLKDNPVVLERLKLKSPQDREEQGLRIRGLNADLLEKEHPELRLDPKIGAAVLIKAQTLFPNQTYADLTSEQRSRTYAMTVLEHRQQVLADARAQAEMQAGVQLAKLPQELALRSASALSLDQAKKNMATVGDTKEYYVDPAGNPAPSDMTIPEARKAGFSRVTQTEFEALNTGQQAMLILRNLKDTVSEMKKEGLFVTKSGLPGLIEQGRIAYQGRFGDTETSRRLLGNLETQKGHMVILMRLLGEKGVRALGAMLPGMEAMSPNKGAPAIEAFLGQIESEIRILGTRGRTPKAFDETPTIFPRRPQKDIPPSQLTVPSNDWKIEEVRP